VLLVHLCRQRAPVKNTLPPSTPLGGAAGAETKLSDITRPIATEARLASAKFVLLHVEFWSIFRKHITVPLFVGKSLGLEDA